MKIPDRVIQNIRDRQEEYMPQLIVIRRRVPLGGGEWGYNIIAEDVKARFIPGFGSFQNVADRFQAITPFHLSVPWDTPLLTADEVIDEAALMFQVREVRKPSSYLTAIQALCDLVND